MTQHTINKLPDFDIEGHRGCRGLMPENTIPAMLHALDLGVTTLEMDASITKDRQVILSHEPFFNHEISTKPNGEYVTEAEEKSLNMFRMNYDEVKTYDVGLKPHPRFPQQKKLAAQKPLLSDVMDSVKAYMSKSKRTFPFFNIETKSLPIGDNLYHPPPAEFVDLLMKVIQEKQLESYVIIQSFDIRTLQYLHQQYPAMKTALLMEGDDQRTVAQQVKELGFVPTIYSPAYSLVTKEVLDYCHELKMKVIPWTVNTLKEIKQLKDLGVDGVITDYPDLFWKGTTTQ